MLAIDQSTSGTKALVIDRLGQIVARSRWRIIQLYPRPGWVEHDPLEIYDNVKRAALEAMAIARYRADSLAALTITNQRETAVYGTSDRSSGLFGYCMAVPANR